MRKAGNPGRPGNVSPGMKTLHIVSQDKKAYIRGRIIISVRERKFLGTKVP